jgi:hypothetical protein
LLLVLGALVMVASGVATVSAYEAHIINTTSHVENALTLENVGVGPHYTLNFGTVFPQEWITKDFKISMSSSFCAWEEHRAVEYDIWVVRKPHPDPSIDFYPWLGDALYIGVDNITGFIEYPEDALPPKGPGHLKHVGYTIPTGPILSERLEKPTPQHHRVVVGLDVPVFREYYNELTDPAKPSGLAGPTVIIEPSDTERYKPDGVTLGAEIKIQVSKIVRLGYVPTP